MKNYSPDPLKKIISLLIPKKILFLYTLEFISTYTPLPSKINLKHDQLFILLSPFIVKNKNN